MTISALFNLAGRVPFVVLTDAGGQFYNRTLATYEARNDAHAADYAFDMTEGATVDAETTYTFDGVFGVGANGTGLTVLCIDRATAGDPYDLDAESFWYEEGGIAGGIWGDGSGSSVPGATGKYVTQADLEEHYDADVIRLWSRKGPDAVTTDVTAVQAAINTGEALVDAKLRKVYPLPLTGPSGSGPLSTTDAAILLGIARPIVASELFFSRPQQQGTDEAISLKSDRKAALAELDLYATGVQYLESPRIDRTPAAPGIG